MKRMSFDNVSLQSCRAHLWLVAFLVILTSPGDNTAHAAEPAARALDAKIYKQRCLLCHSGATPEGVAAEVVAGTSAAKNPPTEATAAALKAMGLKCWRRCEKCWPSK